MKNRKVTPKQAERLRSVLNETGLNQTHFGQHVGVDQRTISKILLGKGAMSEGVAKDISRVFPEYDAAWLLGLSDFKNEKDMAEKLLEQAVSKQPVTEQDASIAAFVEYAKGFGYIPTLLNQLTVNGLIDNGGYSEYIIRDRLNDKKELSVDGIVVNYDDLKPLFQIWKDVTRGFIERLYASKDKTTVNEYFEKKWRNG